MADLTPMAQYKRINATSAGTTVLLDRNGALVRMIPNGNQTGTLSLYDVATAAGSTATNLINTLPNTAGTLNPAIELGYRVKNGCVVVTGGTVDATFVYY